MNNKETKIANQKREEPFIRSNGDASVNLHVSIPSAFRNQEKRWDSLWQFVYREAFIVGVDEVSVKLFSLVFTTYNFYYWVSIFYFPDSLM